MFAPQGRSYRLEQHQRQQTTDCISINDCMLHASAQSAEVRNVAVVIGAVSVYTCVDNHQLQLVVWWLCSKPGAVRVRKVLQATGMLQWTSSAALSLCRGGPAHIGAAGNPLRYIM
jgi:hypothetical protein